MFEGWRAVSIRARTTIAAVTVVAAALVLAGFGITAFEYRSLVRTLDATMRTQAADVVAEVGAGELPATLAVSTEHETLLQVLDARGRVLAASPNLAGEPALAARPATGGPVRTVGVHLGRLRGGSYRVVAVPANGPDGPVTVVVGTSLESPRDSLDDLVEILVISFPLLLGVLGLVIWEVVGRALRPVEAIRREVASITGAAPGRRVSEPPTHDEVARLARTMNDMLSRVDEAARVQRQFVADASHELRSPLAGIRNQLEVDLAYPDEAEWKATEAEVLDETRRMERLVDDLLVLAKADAPVAAGERQPVDLDDLVLREAARLRARGRVHVDTRRVSAGQVIGDRDQLRRIVRNLVDNAERHADTTVAFTVGAHDAWVDLVLEDDGDGIPAGDRERIFERFTRLDPARARPDGGTGLGLAIVRDLVVRHGGTVALDASAPCTRFVVRIPAAEG